MPVTEKSKYRSGSRLVIETEAGHIPLFSRLLQHGFPVVTTEGITITELLCRQIGISHEYLDERIQSILLDGSPVDNPDTATLRDGSVLALSASMPGLVGATLRRESLLASFRGAITHMEDERRAKGGEAVVILKLFNLVMREVGPYLLNQGILTDVGDLTELLKGLSYSFWAGCDGIYLNGKSIDPDALLKGLESEDERWILLQVMAVGAQG